MDFLKDLFGGAKGPQVLPGAPAPTPGKGSDIANMLARILGGAGAGFGAAQGQPQEPPPWLAKMNQKLPLPIGPGMFNRGAAPTPGGGDPAITALLKRIFGQTNPVSPAMPPSPSNQIPTTPPQGGTGGLY